MLQALLAGFFLTACRYETTTYDRLKGNDPGTHIYTPVQHVQARNVRLTIDEASVLHHVKPQCLVFSSCQQASSGLWKMAGVLATDAQQVQAAAPHVFHLSLIHI